MIRNPAPPPPGSHVWLDRDRYFDFRSVPLRQSISRGARRNVREAADAAAEGSRGGGPRRWFHRTAAAEKQTRTKGRDAGGGGGS